MDIRRRFSSPLYRRIAKIYFVAILIVCLSFISFASSLDATRLGTLWCLGTVAVALVVRSWWKERKQ
jgi:hypothetical protein